MLAYDCRVSAEQKLESMSLTWTAVVYLKNRASRAWSSSDDFPQNKQIPEDEKTNLRDRLLPLLASSPPQIRAQLIPLLQKILNADFPSKWPGFLERTLQLLATNDASSVYAGLQCMVGLCRMYRFKGAETRKEFNRIVDASYPQLLVIANGLVQETSFEAWEMLHIIMKAYKHTIYVGHTKWPGLVQAWATRYVSC